MSNAEMSGSSSGGVDRLPSQPRATIVTDELTKLTDLIAGICPEDARISFSFDGKLRVHIDVRTMEQLLVVEMMLPKLAAGLFHDAVRAQAPRHGFGHRVTALVDR